MGRRPPHLVGVGVFCCREHVRGRRRLPVPAGDQPLESHHDPDPAGATMDQIEAPDASRGANPFGVASLIAGVLLLLLGAATIMLSPAIPMLLSRFQLPYQFVGLLTSLPQALVALIGTVLGIVGLLAKGRRRVAAIIGTTICASHLVTALVGFVGSQVVVLLLG